MVALTLRQSDGLDDWWLIERKEHEGKHWMQQTGPNAFSLMCSERISDADVEGYSGEMRGIAEAIEKRGQFSAKRCAVKVEGDRVEFWSPRNSDEPGAVTLAEADALAAEIRKVLG